MPIFINQGDQYKKINITPFNNEKELQILIEKNLLEFLELHFLASEYPTTFGGRIDTLAVDLNGAPVIIEYKLNKNENIINQGLSYLRWLKAQKMEFFEMLILKKLGKDIADKIKIDWANPRVICIAENYSKFDLDTVEVIPMRLELFKYRIYENNIFSLEPLNTTEKAIAVKEKNALNGGIAAQLQPDIKELFEELRSRILQIDEEIIEKETSLYTAYRMSKNFAEIHMGKKALKIYLRPLEYDDPKNIAEKIPDSYNYAMNKRVYLKEKSELDYILKLIEQSYKDVI